MRLLIADRIRRTNRWMMLCLAVALTAMWWLGVESPQPGRAHAASMAVAFTLAQMCLLFVPRAIYQLPVSRREIWRSGWIVATLGGTAFTLAAKAVALVMPSVRASIGLADVVLSTVYDFSATGVACGVVIVATRPQPAGGPFHHPWPILKRLAEMTLPLGLMAGVYGPMWLNVQPPARWTDLGGRGAAVLTAAFALTLATYFHSPGQPSPANRAVRRTSPATVRRSGRFAVTGLPRLLLHEYAWTAMIGGGLALAAATVVIVMASVVHGPQDLVEFSAGALLRLDGSSSPLARGLAPFNLLIWYALFASTLAARFPATLRHLRVVPLGAARLNALLLAWPSFFWLSVWLALALLHYGVLGTGLPSLHADIFVALVGLSAVVQAVTLRLTGVVKLVAFAAAALLAPLLHFVSPPHPAAAALVGVACLAAAALINRRALFSSSTYRIS